MWNNLETIEDLKEAIKLSSDKDVDAVLIFKHSKRCGTSLFKKRDFESGWSHNEKILLYHIDIFAHRDISDKVEELLQVPHHSPQVIVIKNGRVIYNESHGFIDINDILKSV